jgi:hypothetical protein
VKKICSLAVLHISFGYSLKGIDMTKAIYLFCTVGCLICACICWAPEDKIISIQDFQQRELIDKGYPLPIHGADGKLGTESTDAWNRRWIDENN